MSILTTEMDVLDMFAQNVTATPASAITTQKEVASSNLLL